MHYLATITARGENSLAPSDRTKLIEELAANLASVYAQATPETIVEGRAWYELGAVTIAGIASRTGRTFDQVASLVAVTSPRRHWNQNLAIAEQLALGSSLEGLFADQVVKCRHILADPTGAVDWVRGEKVSRFRRNLAGDQTVVTVDIWAIRAALADLTLGETDYKYLVGTPTRYRIVEEAYQLAARRAGHSPAVFQAIVWVIVRDQLEELDADLPAPF